MEFCPKVSVIVTVVLSTVGALVTVISHPHAGWVRIVLDGTKVSITTGDSRRV